MYEYHIKTEGDNITYTVPGGPFKDFPAQEFSMLLRELHLRGLPYRSSHRTRGKKA